MTKGRTVEAVDFWVGYRGPDQNNELAKEKGVECRKPSCKLITYMTTWKLFADFMSINVGAVVYFVTPSPSRDPCEIPKLRLHWSLTYGPCTT
jgi:hypothetical protein